VADVAGADFPDNGIYLDGFILTLRRSPAAPPLNPCQLELSLQSAQPGLGRPANIVWRIKRSRASPSIFFL
jgi:hypothetical protein